MDANAHQDRPLGPAIKRGWALRCPNCGNGPLMSGYLKTRDDCLVCGQEFHHHRADDGPAWATMLITGHLMAPLMIMVYELWEPAPGVMAAVFSLVFVALSLYLLPRLKGCFVGAQWAKRMYGFDAELPSIEEKTERV